jgi:cytidylate kinase
MKKIIVAIDGPAGSGKTTTAKIAAEKLGYIYIDTGAMYRAVTLAWIRSGIEITPENAPRVMENLAIRLEQSDGGQITSINGEDVSSEIRTPDVTKLVSPVSAVEFVREKMYELQRRLGQEGGVVMDGRDIGTTVFPKAELKIYLTASIEARAKRRLLELKSKGIEQTLDETREQIAARDKYDSTRPASPLRKAEDAIEINTSELTIDQQTDMIIDLARNKISS